MQETIARYRLLILTSVAGVFIVLGVLSGWLPFRPSEVFGIITGVACVVLAIRQNIWNFPVGMLSNICFAILFWSAHLYGIMGVQVIYLALNVHGWYSWSRRSEQPPLQVSRIRRTETVLLTLLGIPAVLVLTWYLRGIGDASPFLDSLATVMSLIAQFLLNLKRLESWSIGAVVDVIYTVVYISQGLYLTAVLYAFYLVMCLLGYFEWRDALRKHRDEPSASAPPEPSRASSTP